MRAAHLAALALMRAARLAALALVLASLVRPEVSFAAAERLRLEVGSGRMVELRAPAANLFVADPKIAEVRPASPTSLFVFGLAAGHTTVAAVDAAGRLLAEEDLFVDPSSYAATQAGAALARLLPGSRVAVTQSGSNLVLSGSVATPAAAARAVLLVHGFAAPGGEVLNDLRVQAQTQVTLAVRIVEMDRSVTRSLGVDWTALGTIGSIAKLPALNTALNGGTAAACAAGPIGSVLCQGLNLNAAIDALASDGLIRVLAEPNLTVLSGEQASFLVGGEFPIPVGQQNGSITIEFKRYGVQLSFVPTVQDDGRITLNVSPEVSQLSQQGAVTLTEGNSTIQVPALTVRRAQTTVELGSGQSFAIAGLLQDSSTRTVNGLPGLRTLPILGNLFASRDYQSSKTELVILVTPVISRAVDNIGELHEPADKPEPAEAAAVIPVPEGMRTPNLPPGVGFVVK